MVVSKLLHHSLRPEAAPTMTPNPSLNSDAPRRACAPPVVAPDSLIR